MRRSQDSAAPRTAAPDPAEKDSVAPVRHSVDVPLSPQEAFALFTEGLTSWWPLDSHSVAAGKDQRPTDVTVEPREGGRVIETLPDGTEVPWATVTEWLPGRRLALAWYPGQSEQDATDVEVTFAPLGNGCRVIVHHSGFARLGDRAASVATSYRSGWPVVLGTCFARAASLHPA